MDFKVLLGYPLHELHVYVIEDDSDLRLQIVTTLKQVGYYVHDFSCAEDFIRENFHESPSVIVTDMVLPGASGLQLIQQVRQAGIDTPFIYISGDSSPNQIISGMKLGAVDFLWKPFNTCSLLTVIRESLSKDIRCKSQKKNETKNEQDWCALTEREKEVCKLMLKGYGNTDIAKQLDIKPDTANKHRMQVLKKMSVANRPQLIEKLENFSLIHNN